MTVLPSQWQSGATLPRTPLSYAAGNYRSTEIMRILMQRDDVDLNSQDKHGRTPLSYATIDYSGDCVALLLNHPNIQPDCPDYTGRTPLSYAAETAAEEYDSVEMVALLAQREDVDINSQDIYGRTPLSHATEMENVCAAAQYLLDNYVVDVNAKSKGLQTALSIAVGKPNLDVASLLLSRGDVDRNVRDQHGRTALYIAVDSLHRIPDWSTRRDEVIKMIDLLRQYGAEEDGPDLLQCLNDVECNEIWDFLYG
ncbi:ankyrin repeat-containing domain protein [Mycena floridula]|nr:ankyrin repeat-containing domain protein [Mycena floridula]